ncbi:MAG: chemotaxis protein CheV [Chromatiaceae bacterium]|nr:chemotaxis protein CheV [Gammaproteobacteria bacterium]MCB1878537.1 chemotaxis protein CheV [Gammaproteobacteria bacterium]MCB1903498.1 chemotaxis protein CheV [Gammaproteobacteria bacterium]MCP5448188.1 chemotaxis protein CheV [Chromatiaceae bacterium]
MTSFIQSVDARTQLAGTNRLEVLLFSLGNDTETGREEVFGINVFKVREVMHVPVITHAPDMPEAVEGMVSLRGTMVPVINLQKFCGVRTTSKPKILMITEYNKHIQGFLVDSVDMIERLNWDEIKAPPQMLTSRLGGLVTAVAELNNGNLVMIMDVEKVLAETAGFYDNESFYEGIEPLGNNDITVLFADDSSVARNQIKKTLEKMGVKYISTINGMEAWKLLTSLTDQAEASGINIADKIQLILTDVEMPEMDGYVLTRRIKEDPRFAKIPVIMHSSLTADANQNLGKGVGADAYVPKFQPHELSHTLSKLLDKVKGKGQ